MKKLIAVLFLSGLVSGCAASPIDVLVPAAKPSPATVEYLGHLYHTNYVNQFYYSTTDALIQEKMVDLRDKELAWMKAAAEGETKLYLDLATETSNGIWGGLMALAGILGWQIPSPRENAKVTEALHTPVPDITPSQKS